MKKSENQEIINGIKRLLLAVLDYPVGVTFTQIDAGTPHPLECVHKVADVYVELNFEQTYHVQMIWLKNLNGVKNSIIIDIVDGV